MFSFAQKTRLVRVCLGDVDRRAFLRGVPSESLPVSFRPFFAQLPAAESASPAQSVVVPSPAEDVVRNGVVAVPLFPAALSSVG